MNKNNPTIDNWRISEMAAHLPKEMLLYVDPIGDSAISPSSDKIKQLALNKRREYLNRNEEKPVKKSLFRIILVAAIVSTLSITAFAAFGGLELIKGIFGDSANSVQNEIATPQVSASAGGRDMALEALLTDGYVTNMVISLTGDQPSDKNLFAVETDTSLRSNGWYVLEDFTQPEKTYYVVDFVSEKRFESAGITLSLNREVAPIDLPILIENKLGNAVVKFPENAMSGQTRLKELQVSPMGFLLIGHEDNAQGGLPTTNIRLLFSDGKKEDMEVEFSPSDETVGGGGGMVMSGKNQKAPLVTMFQGTRNPDGDLVINGQFSRIINVDKIDKIIIDDVEYQGRVAK